MEQDLLISRKMKLSYQVLIGFWVGVFGFSCTHSTDTNSSPSKLEGYWEGVRLVTRYYHLDSMLVETSVIGFANEHMIKFEGRQVETIDGTIDTCYGSNVENDVVYTADSIYRYTSDPSGRHIHKAYGTGESDSTLIYMNSNNPNYWCPRISCLYFDTENDSFVTTSQDGSNVSSHLKITLQTNRFEYKRITRQRYREYLEKTCRNQPD